MTVPKLRGRATLTAFVAGAFALTAVCMPQIANAVTPADDSAQEDGTLQYGVQWPLESQEANITDGFGNRVSPCSGCSSNHRGLDFSAAHGTPVGSIAGGTVVSAVYSDGGGLGIHVVIEHDIDGIHVESVYGHLAPGSITVAPGDEVGVGERIGSVGNTGSSTGPHLHLETIVDGVHVDPLAVLQKYADGEDIEITDRPSLPGQPTNPGPGAGDADDEAPADGGTEGDDAPGDGGNGEPDIDNTASGTTGGDTTGTDENESVGGSAVNPAPAGNPDEGVAEEGVADETDDQEIVTGTDSSEASDSDDTVAPFGTSGVDEPADPVASPVASPADPTDPAETAAPEPNDPSEPAPSTPTEPEATDEPDEPLGPPSPGDGSGPAIDDQPVDPDTPAVPSSPIVPGTSAPLTPAPETGVVRPSQHGGLNLSSSPVLLQVVVPTTSVPVDVDESSTVDVPAPPSTGGGTSAGLSNQQTEPNTTTGMSGS